jgi:hypothetical protein
VRVLAELLQANKMPSGVELLHWGELQRGGTRLSGIRPGMFGHSSGGRYLAKNMATRWSVAGPTYRHGPLVCRQGSFGS